MPSPNTWDKHEIKAAIGRRGLTLKALAEKYDIDPSSIRVSLHRKTPCTAADQVISDFLGVPLHVLWPERYDDKGHRLVKLRPISDRKTLRRRKASKALSKSKRGKAGDRS